MSISTGIDVIQILEGEDASRGTIEAMAGAWQDGVLTRAVRVTPPPTPLLADLLRRIAGNVDLVQVAEGTRFLDRLRAGLERTTGATVAVVADDVEVSPGWWAPLSKALESGAAISATCGAISSSCWAGSRTC